MKTLIYCTLIIGLVFHVAHQRADARGFGGFHGGGMAGGGLRGGGMGGGGFRGSMPGGGSFGGTRSIGGPSLSGGNFPAPSRGGGSARGGLSPSSFGGRLPQLNGGGQLPSTLQNRFNGGNLSGRIPNLNQNSAFNRGALSNLNRTPGQGPLSGNGQVAGRGALSGQRPNASQLSQFLGIPSDKGLHHLSGETQSRASQLYDRAKSGSGPFADRISGETQSRLSQLYDAAKSGSGPGKFIPGETQKPLSRLYDNAKAGDRPFKNFIPGETQKPLSRLYDRARNSGNHPLHPWSPWSVHNNAIVIRRNFNNYFIFTAGWYRRYPAAWYPAAWYYGDPWLWAPWPTLAPWCGYTGTPIEYNYGDNIVYQQDSVTVNGNAAGTPQEYAQQAQQLAEDGGQGDSADTKEWMSLGVFAVSKENEKSASMMMQLAINQAGVIRGNYNNTTTKDTQVIQGKVDKQSLRAAWTIGDHSDIVLDTGIYNLTKEETSVLVHFDQERTEQWLMVRMKQKDDSTAKSDD